MYKPPVIDAEFIRYPRELDGAPRAAALDPEVVVEDFISGKESRRQKQIHDMIMRSINEDLARSFYCGNKARSKSGKE